MRLLLRCLSLRRLGDGREYLIRLIHAAARAWIVDRIQVVSPSSLEGPEEPSDRGG